MSETRTFVRMRPEGRISKTAKIFLGKKALQGGLETRLADRRGILEDILARWSMIRKSGHRFSEKIMLKQ